MKILDHAPILDAILDSWKTTLGSDFVAYRNHCYRVLNFSLALNKDGKEIINKVSVAAAFHDLGIWANATYDYLEPSKELARRYLVDTNQDAWCEEIEAMIEQHHKLFRYKARSGWLVEAFRKADWVDVSRGRFRFGLPTDFVASVMNKFPNAGFHKLLIGLTKQRFKTHPFSPLPMMKF